MCGLWGYAGDRGADPEILSEIAKTASRRGPDGWGVWSDGKIWRGTGVINPKFINIDASVIIGHARLSTMLGAKEPANGQPLCCSDIVLSHNGSVWNYGEIKDLLQLSTGCDSEALAIALSEKS